MACDLLNDRNGVINEFEARLPSALSGVALVALTIALGAVLAGRLVGLIAGLLLVSGSGYIFYTHCARPEMLYAALCTAGLVCFARAERAAAGAAGADGPGDARWAWLGWGALGLAMLTKGPQLPVIIVAGWLVGAITSGRLRSSLRALRPLTGLSIFLLVSIWWFVAMLLVIPDAAGIIQGETIDRYATGQEPWWKLLDPYYVYRTFALVLPWVVLFPFALVGRWNLTLKHDAGYVRLWWVVVGAMLLLSLSFGRRWYYMLPVLAPLAVLMAAAGLQLLRELSTRGSTWKWGVFLVLHVVAIVIIASLIVQGHRARLSGVVGLQVALAVAGAVVATLLIVPSLRRRIGPAGGLAATAVGTIVMFTAVAWTGAFWHTSRFERAEFARHLALHVDSDDVLTGWGDQWAEEQHALHRPIRPFPERSSTKDAAAKLWILIDARSELPSLHSSLMAQAVIRADYDGDENRLQLWRVATRMSSDAASGSSR